MFFIEHLPTGETIADEIPFLELPWDLLGLGDFKDLRVVFSSVAVANDAVAVGEFLQTGHPAEVDVGSGNLIFDFPNHLAIGRYLDDAFASAGSNERVAVCEADGAVHARLDEVIPNDFSGAIIFGDYARYFGANEQGAFGCVAGPAGVLRGAGLEGELMDELALWVDFNHPADAALDDHGVAIGKSREGVDMHAFAGVTVLLGRVVGPDHFLIERDFLELSPSIVKEDVAVGQ